MLVQTSDIHAIYSTVASAPVSGDSSYGSAPWPLGETFHIGASSEAQDLLTIDSAGAVAGDAYITLPAGGARVTLPGNHGPLILRAIANTSGSTIQRGEVIQCDVSEGPFYGEIAATNAEPTQILGVALFDIPNNSIALVAMKGAVYALCAAAVTNGNALDVSGGTAGNLETIGSAEDASCARALETTAGAGLALVAIDARG